MAHYSVATDNAELSGLIDKAVAGEELILVQGGKPPVQLSLVEDQPRPKLSREEWWNRLREFRESMPPATISAVDLIREMRDEGP